MVVNFMPCNLRRKCPAVSPGCHQTRCLIYKINKENTQLRAELNSLRMLINRKEQKIFAYRFKE